MDIAKVLENISLTLQFYVFYRKDFRDTEIKNQVLICGKSKVIDKLHTYIYLIVKQTY